jgi:hypothetical protein
MPSTLHEAIVDVFRQRPTLAPELVHGALGVALPGYDNDTVRCESGDLTELVPTEYRADVVIALADPARPNERALAMVVEVQLRADRRKRWVWPQYLAGLRARLECPVMLLVVAPDADAAGWCAKPIDMGHPGWALRPLVLGPDRVPVVIDAETVVRKPELAVLSALAHATGPDRDKLLPALVIGLSAVDDVRGSLYADVVFALLPEAARLYVEDLMSTSTYREYKSEFARKYISQGRAEGEAKGRAEGVAEGRAEGVAEGRVDGEAAALLVILETRGIPVPEEIRGRIRECGSLEQLETWVRTAATAESIEDVFG